MLSLLIIYNLLKMRKIVYLCVLFTLIFSACKIEKKDNTTEKEVTYITFGDKISADNAITKEAMAKKFDNLKVGDTIDVKFTSTIESVCQKKGCWINVPLDGDKKSFVKFKDYAFFLPMNSAGSDVILNGKAFIREISVDRLKHYAQDAGKSEEEIAKITEPKRTYAFLADGVLLADSSDEK